MRKRSVWLTVLAALPISLAAQDRLRTMPGYEQAQRVAREGPVVRGGALSATWIDANAFEYTRDGKRYRYDVAARHASEIDATQGEPSEGRGRPVPPAEAAGEGDSAQPAGGGHRHPGAR